MSCQLSTLNALAQVKAAVGSLAKIRRVIRVEGVLNVASDFIDYPPVLNGASHLINAVFEERGRHTRMVYASREVPLDCTSLIILWAEVDT